MSLLKANKLACPLDGLGLNQQDKQLCCANGHSFDMAKQGYVNLLPVQHKRSLNPGDSKAMVDARRALLDSGIYQPISELLNNEVIAQLNSDNFQHPSDLCLLDAGCGEGYYLARLADVLLGQQGQNNFNLIGIDIAKPAIMAACQRNKAINWLVASNKNLPVLAESIDMILCLFGFPVYEAFHTTLRNKGLILLVDPGAGHLIELREIIYHEVRKTPPPALTQAEQLGFSLINTIPLQFKTKLINQTQIQNLLGMTPHLFKASQSGKQAANELEEIEVTVEVVLRVLQKN